MSSSAAVVDGSSFGRGSFGGGDGVAADESAEGRMCEKEKKEG